MFLFTKSKHILSFMSNCRQYLKSRVCHKSQIDSFLVATAIKKQENNIKSKLRWLRRIPGMSKNTQNDTATNTIQMTTDIELGRVSFPKKKSIDATCLSKKWRRRKKCLREERKKNKNSWRILIHSNAILVVPRFADCVRVQTTVASSSSSSSFSWFFIVVKNSLKMDIKLKIHFFKDSVQKCATSIADSSHI